MPPTDDELKRFLAGLLPADEAARVAAWVEVDPHAVAALDRLANEIGLAAALKGTPPATPDDNTRRIPAVPETAGTLVAGRYKLLQRIGEGGMGTVWMADQTEPVRRRVAVKLIRTDKASSASILARFEAERQAIALMDHPNIARLLDAGTTGDGVPFFVMELVKGVPLTEYCDANRLSVPERLTLFARICAGVQHAHQKGVIHRDLKPGNILVESHDGRPVPKVIDFGLAKATTGLPLTDHTLFTGFGTVLGTPLYMAPEQANVNAVDVDTRADVYALGVILYELLTGSTPITRETVKQVAMEEMIRLIREQEAPTPSSRISSSEAKPSIAANRQTEPAKLGRFVRGELDWIVLKALSKERDRRYESASGLAADVERFLNHEPVVAGPPSASYRLRKFVRRNRPQVVAASLVLLALLAGAIGTTVGWFEAKKQEGIAAAAQDGEAKAEQAKAEAVAEKKNADQARDAADQERKKVETLNAVIETFEYGKTIQMAHQEWRDGNITKARALLAGTKPELRGWEYRYLQRLLNGERLSFQPHTGSLHWAAYNSDGTRIVTAGFDSGKPGSVRVWDAKSGAELLAVKVTQSITRVAFSPDDTRIVGMGGNTTGHVWDAKTGDELLVLKGVNGVFYPQTFATYSPSGDRIFTGSWDNTARVFDARTGAALSSLKGHAGQVQHVSFNADGTRIVTASDDKTAKVWDATTGEVLLTLKGHDRGVHSAWFSPDGKRIVTAGAIGAGTADEPARVWDADTGKELLTITHPRALWCLACSKDGTRIVTGGSDQTARVWEARTGAELLTLKGHTRDVRSAFFSPDGTRILTASGDRTVKVWDANTGAEYRPIGDRAAIFPAFFSPDGSRFLARSLDERVKVCDTLTGKTLLSLDGHTTRKPGDFFGPGTFGLNSASYSADGTRIVTASNDGTAKVWDARTGALLRSLALTTKWGNHACANADGTRVVTVGEAKVVKVWDATSGAELVTLAVPSDDPKRPDSVQAVAFTPDGKGVVTAGTRVRFWDANTGTELRALDRGATAVGWVSFSADGKRMITAGSEQTSKVWDVATGTPLLTLRGHTDGLKTAHFHPNGTRIVTASNDGTAKVWDATTGAELLTLKLPREGLLSAVFCPVDGSRILTANNFNGLLKIWDSRPVAESVREQKEADDRKE